MDQGSDFDSDFRASEFASRVQWFHKYRGLFSLTGDTTPGDFISFMAFITTIVLASIFPNSFNIFATLLNPLLATAY